MVDSSIEDLPALVARLGDQIAVLVDGKLRLLKLDVEDEVRSYARETLFVGLGAVAVAIGVTLVAAGLAFALAYVLPTLDPLLVRAIAFGVVGALGVVGGMVVLRRFGAHLISRSVGGASDADGAHV
jgi:hypothetical protein